MSKYLRLYNLNILFVLSDNLSTECCTCQLTTDIWCLLVPCVPCLFWCIIGTLAFAPAILETSELVLHRGFIYPYNTSLLPLFYFASFAFAPRTPFFWVCALPWDISGITGTQWTPIFWICVPYHERFLFPVVTCTP